MKKRTFNVLLFAFSFIVGLSLLTRQLTADVINDDKVCAINVTVYGSENTSATVWAVNVTTGQTYYLNHEGGGEYSICPGVANGTYNIYACSANMHGSSLNQVLNGPLTLINTTINLQSGYCPYVPGGN